MTSLFKTRINTEMFIDIRAALYKPKGACKNKGKREEGKIMDAKEYNRWE